ncbi:hypothetical protein [Sphingopyxis sp. MSC1_008]|jgi:hypothetical protein|uniref:hypothetical protein n=1 Tax=Sphingopyxis sp. MSC1_008 TaxID=2909265 RepID=UPI0020BDFBD6|nr:hypothetical protein [Sphingopyxis sp. MSC1_008]
MTKQFNGIFRTWTRVQHARHGALPVLWGDCIVHLSHPEFSGNILHTSGIIDIIEHGGFKIAQTRNNYYALLGPELQIPPGDVVDLEAFILQHRSREPALDVYASAAMNADPGCINCGGAGVYRCGEDRLCVCDRCCKHNQGWWQLEGGYGADNGRWACKAGCGVVVDKQPPVLQFLPRTVA